LLSSLLTEGANIEEIVFEFNEALKKACNNSFQTQSSEKLYIIQILPLVDCRPNNPQKKN
jgi:hypothetical protein